MKKPVIMTAREACGHIRDGAVIVNTGMLLAANAEAVLTAMEESFLQTRHPSGLTLMHSSSQSDRVGGIEHLAHPGMVDRMIGSHWGLAPKWMRCIADNEICAYNIPQGQMTHLLRSMACGEYGNVTKVGLGTFIDPRIEGGKMNEKARQREDIYEVVTLGGEEYLHYKPILPDVALIRGTSMDEDGNLSVEEEGVKLELLTAALAVKRNGGRVIAQVKRFVKNGSIHPQRVVVPGVFIDIAVPCTDPEKDHRQCSSIVYSPAVCGDGKEELSAHSGSDASAGSPDIRFLIGRRAAMELHEDDVINMGIGIPNDTIGVILEQEGLKGFAVPTVESGIYGGVALGGADFGVGKTARRSFHMSSSSIFTTGEVLMSASWALARSTGLEMSTQQKWESRSRVRAASLTSPAMPAASCSARPLRRRDWIVRSGKMAFGFMRRGKSVNLWNGFLRCRSMGSWLCGRSRGSWWLRSARFSV